MDFFVRSFNVNGWQFFIHRNALRWFGVDLVIRTRRCCDTFVEYFLLYNWFEQLIH